jgi:hypothetical protein
MSAPHGHTTTYDSNKIDGNAIAILGDVHGDIHFPDRSGGSELNQCLPALRVNDPREDRARIEGGKDRLLRDCYTCILDDADFQRWKTHGDSRLLWIRGDPGKGKTMMTMGLIDELSEKQGDISRTISNMMAKLGLSSGPCVLAYFFCQSTRPELNNAISVLRGLIYMLVTQQEQLLRHVQKHYNAAGRKLFERPDVFYTLREMLLDIINDPTLPMTYLLVDALDECTSGLSALLSLITDDRLARRSRVKWLVTSLNYRVVCCVKALTVMVNALAHRAVPNVDPSAPGRMVFRDAFSSGPSDCPQRTCI